MNGAEPINRAAILAEMLNELMPGWVVQAPGFVRGPDALAVAITNGHSDSPVHLDLDFILNVDNREKTSIIDCVDEPFPRMMALLAAAGPADDLDYLGSAVRRAVQMWLESTGQAVLSLLGQPASQSAHFAGHDPLGFPGWHTIASPVSGWSFDDNPIAEWMVSAAPWHQLAADIEPEIDRAYLNGIKLFLAAAPNSVEAEVRINGRRNDSASEALIGLDWPRPDSLATGRTYLILVEPDPSGHPSP